MAALIPLRNALTNRPGWRQAQRSHLQSKEIAIWLPRAMRACERPSRTTWPPGCSASPRGHCASCPPIAGEDPAAPPRGCPSPARRPGPAGDPTRTPRAAGAPRGRAQGDPAVDGTAVKGPDRAPQSRGLCATHPPQSAPGGTHMARPDGQAPTPPNMATASLASVRTEADRVAAAGVCPCARGLTPLPYPSTLAPTSRCA
jgi:hypothetical protein